MVTEAEFRTSILPFTLHEEGGLSLERQDRGNWTGGAVGKGEPRGTKYGISAAAHPTLDIRDLTVAQACDLYWDEYCRKPGFDRLALPLLQVVFDAGVMSGPERASTWLAEARRYTAIKDQIAAFSAARLAFCKARSTWRRYGAGWGARIDRCQTRALLLVAVAPVAIRADHPVPHAASKPAASKPAAPKPALQPQVGLLAQLARVLLDALFSPICKGAYP